MNKCQKCNREIQGNYCSHCGHPQQLERINSKYILSEIGEVLNLQKGISYTIKELLVRPGKNIRQFIHEDRNRLVKPILFTLVCSLIYTLFVQVFHFKDGYINFNYDDWSGSATSTIFHWISENYGYSNILMAVFVALWIKIFFRKYDYNFYEILILLLFVIGIEMLMFAFFGALESLTQMQVLSFGVNLALLYVFWAIGQFFEKRKIWNYVKAFFSYILGMLTFVLVATLLGLFIDLIK